MEEKKNKFCAALYLRLSKDDYGINESSSISTQKKMLLAYAREHFYFVYDIYIDDGFSGTNFERPAFRRMISDIENKCVNLVITKDLSRLGRDYIATGQYTEIYFPSKNVRFIAINDGYDSESPLNDIAPFKNIMNEMYARDISKKIKSAFQTKMKEGAYIGNFAPYGYQKDDTNKNHLVIDEYSGKIVSKMFHMAEEGRCPAEIAFWLNKNKILSPLEYRKNKLNTSLQTDSTILWTSGSVSKILKNEVYMGHTIQGKTCKISFKTRCTVAVPKKEQIVVTNTHLPIVSSDTFKLVQKRRLGRRIEKHRGNKNIFSGLAVCMDCGRNMSSAGTDKNGNQLKLVCGGYKLNGKKACTNHFVDYNMLKCLVLNEIKLHLMKLDGACVPENIVSNVSQVSSIQKDKSLSIKRRYEELDFLISKLYESYALGEITDERFQKLLNRYEKEQCEAKMSLTVILDKFDSLNQISRQSYAELWEVLIRPESLDTELLFLLVDHIEVGQLIKEKGEKHLRLKIFYRFEK